MTTATAPISGRRDWGTAFAALKRLLDDANDTAQVFRIVRALNTDTARKGYARLLRTAQGGRIAYDRVELAECLSDPAYVTRFADGTVGAAYRAFLEKTGYSAQGLAAVSRTDDDSREAAHPYAWFGRRTRDSHDIWHILTGYEADDPLGELCLVAFSYGQLGGLGWALIALGGVGRALRVRGGNRAIEAIWEGYRRGRKAAWLPSEDYDALFAESLADARVRLGLGTPAAYDSVRG